MKGESIEEGALAGHYRVLRKAKNDGMSKEQALELAKKRGAHANIVHDIYRQDEGHMANYHHYHCKDCGCQMHNCKPGCDCPHDSHDETGSWWVDADGNGVPDVLEGWEELPPINREKYQQRDGLEGPIQTRSGKTIYYDTKAGMYYDPDTDMYLSYDDFRMLDKKGMHKVSEQETLGAKFKARGGYKPSTYKVGGNLNYDDKADFTLSADDAALLNQFMYTASDEEFKKVWQMFWSSQEQDAENPMGPVNAINYVKQRTPTDEAVNEDISQDAHHMQRDHEVQMARSDLYKLANYSIKLHSILKGISEEQGLEGWMQAKITKAADYIGSVYHALEYDMLEKSQSEPIAPAESIEETTTAGAVASVPMPMGKMIKRKKKK